MRRCPALALAAAAGAVHAHAPDAPAASWSLQWNLAPWLLLSMAASAGLYATGVMRLWRHAGLGRGIAPREVAAFGAGWLALGAALISPLDPLGAQLFSAHMLQHELMMVVAAPLLVIGRPLAAWAWALPPHSPALRLWQGRAWLALWRALCDPLVAWAFHALVLWAWHVPLLFEAALGHEPLHIAQHASFFVSALFYWWSVLGHDPRGRYGAGHAFVSLFTTMLHTGALGALLTLAPTPWYATYVPRTAQLALDPVEDQQLGGLVMWVPAGLAYVAAALAVLTRLLGRGSAQAAASQPVSTTGSSTHSA